MQILQFRVLKTIFWTFNAFILLMVEQVECNPCYARKSHSRRGIRSSAKYRARSCMPSFVNAAYNRPITASSTCGSPKSKYCWNDFENGKLTKECQTCDESDPTNRHSAAYLTDPNSNSTCWISEGFRPHQQPNVTLHLSLGKRYELTYISLTFCTLRNRPDSLAIFRSNDFGKSWKPYQYYSSDCERVYGTSRKDYPEFEDEVLCTDNNKTYFTPYNQNLLIFTSLQRKRISSSFDNSKALQEWVSFTDLKFVFTRALPISQEINKSNNDFLHYAVRDILVGGRCKCNGHAGQCLTDEKGLTSCDCQHNTEGRDCQQCKPFFVDRPWKRATEFNANPCVACQCHLHSKECVYDPHLFEISGQKSGGKCLKCRHNTKGNHCEQCANGYYRNIKYPMNHKLACRKCRCHPVGAVNRICNSETGQCSCKEGVVGRYCTKCQSGFHQSSDQERPCIRIPVPPGPSAALPTNKFSCNTYKPCRINSKRVNARKFCKRNFVIGLRVLFIDALNEWTKITINIQEVYKEGANLDYTLGERTLWLPTTRYNCGCPSFKEGQRYLLLGNDENRSELTIDNKSILIKWKNNMTKKMKRFQRLSKKDKCRKYIHPNQGNAYNFYNNRRRRRMYSYRGGGGGGAGGGRRDRRYSTHYNQ